MGQESTKCKQGSQENRKMNRMSQSYSSEVITAGLDGLDEEATSSGVAVDSTDEILHWGLMGKADEVTNVVDDQPS